MSTSDIDFGLSDPEYWTDPQRTLTPVAEQLWDRNHDCVVVGAPAHVDLGARASLPISVVRAGSYAELAGLDFYSRAVVTAVELDSKRVRVGRLVVVENAEPPVPPPGPLPDGESTNTAVVDLRERLGLPWRRSSYLVTVILRDMVSNRVRVELGTAPGAYRDEEVERFVAEARGRLEPLPVSPAPTPADAPADALPSYRARPTSPPIPEGSGIAFEVERVAVLQPGRRVPLVASFRLPVWIHELVKDPPPGDPDPPRAIVSLSLIATASDDAVTAVLEVRAPVWSIEQDEQQWVAKGHFAFDLLTCGLVRPIAQTYFVYALAGDVMVGPVAIALVEESRITGR